MSAKSEFAIGVDIGRLQPPNDGAAYIWLPNDTQVNLVGDPEIIKQVIKHLDGLVITYREKGRIL